MSKKWNINALLMNDSSNFDYKFDITIDGATQTLFDTDTFKKRCMFKYTSWCIFSPSFYDPVTDTYINEASNINDAIGNRNLNDLINDLIENRNVDDLKKLPKEIQKEIKEYFESIYKGHWGDNEDDSKMISDGFNDYYAVNGIDKAQIIEEERKLQ